MAKVLSLNISKTKGVPKENVVDVMMTVNHGIEGDAHAGNWHRQVSLLAFESIEKMTKMGLNNLNPGIFAENITTQGIEVHKLKIGTKLKIGDAILEVTQIGKECHTRCAIYHNAGTCVMPLEGIFAKVIEGGKVKIDDSITIMTLD